MGGGKQIYQENFLKGNNDSVTGGIRWVVLENGNDDSHSDSIESTYEDSTDSNATTFSSSDVVDDASSSSSKASSSSSYGPLYELSELMAQLPIKRGISKHYQGKSESFGCLASVKSLEDLAKKGYSFRKRVKPCNNNNKSKYSPKATISKKGTTERVSFLTSSQVSSTTFLGTCRAPNPIHVQTHL